MANVIISEYTKEQLGYDKAGLVVQTVVEPALIEISTSVTIATSYQFDDKTVRVRIFTDAYLEFLIGGSSVNADTSQGKAMPSNAVEYFDISDTNRYISLYNGTS